jgi:hypothetical protein
MGMRMMTGQHQQQMFTSDGELISGTHNSTKMPMSPFPIVLTLIPNSKNI